jgi:glycosyltransferase involved in cell wall biosynthesis
MDTDRSENLAARTFGSEPKRPTVAIVVPNYNHARYLPDSLASISAQSRQPDEVLIVDDGSSDDSIAVIERFLSEHPHWRLIKHAERRGVVERQNEALAEVRSEWITFLGADDLLSPGFLDCASEIAARYPGAGLVCGCVEVFGDLLKRSLRPPILPKVTAGFVSPDGFRKLLQFGDNYFLGTGSLYRRAAVLGLGGFDKELGSISDSFLARQLAARFGFGFAPRVFGYWRIHGQNYSVSTATDPQRLDDRLKSVQLALGGEPAGAFPENYGSLLARRLRFGGIRLITLDQSSAVNVRASRIAALLPGGVLERRLLAAVMMAGFPGAVLALAWSSIRLRPFSLSKLFRHLPIRRAILNGAQPPRLALGGPADEIANKQVFATKTEERP